jgi:hypothetical protein
MGGRGVRHGRQEMELWNSSERWDGIDVACRCRQLAWVMDGFRHTKDICQNAVEDMAHPKQRLNEVSCSQDGTRNKGRGIWITSASTLGQV